MQENLQDFGYFNTGNIHLPPASSAGESLNIPRTSISSGTLIDTIKEKVDIEDFSFDIQLIEKRINYERFLGLWRNKEGKYKQGEEFDPNGIKVPYPLPEEKKAKIYPPEQMSTENNQDISELIGLLQLHSNTQMHEQLMKYYWNIWMGREIYDVNLDGILDFFNTDIFTNISGGSSPSSLLKRYIRSWEGAVYNSDKTKYVIVDDRSRE